MDEALLSDLSQDGPSEDEMHADVHDVHEHGKIVAETPRI